MLAAENNYVNLRTAIAKAMIAAVVVNAAAGVIALTISSGKQLGSFEGHILLTTLSASVAAIACLPCVIAWESRRGLGWPMFHIVAIGSILAGGGSVVALIWTDSPTDDLNKITWTLAVAGFGMSLVCLLALARLQRPQAWVRVTAYALDVLLAAQLIFAIWWAGEDDDNRWRLVAATTILLAAAAVLVPILQRLSGSSAAGSQRAAGFCPGCGAALGQASDVRVTCTSCGAVFSVDFA